MVDGFIIAGTEESTADFLTALNKRFQLGSTDTGKSFKFLGSNITRDDLHNISMHMADYLSRIRPVNLTKGRTIEPNAHASGEETKGYRPLAGTLLFLGQTVLPQACLVASKMQQQLGSLRITHIVDANQTVREMMKLSPSICFRKPSHISNIGVTTLSDASHCGRNETYGQTGVINGLKIQCTNEVLFHLIM